VQNIAAGQEGSAAAIAAVKAAADLHSTGGTASADVARLALLACLRFEERAPNICSAGKGAAPASLEALSRQLLAFGGMSQRSEELFSQRLLGNIAKMMGEGEGGSVYMQHVPLLARQLEAAADGKLDAKKYPVGALSHQLERAAFLRVTRHLQRRREFAQSACMCCNNLPLKLPRCRLYVLDIEARVRRADHRVHAVQ
jgi:hypothetical protein